MKLTRDNITKVSPASGVVIPDTRVFALPERVLQFGTGVLLRGLPDYYIDKANRQGVFNGRIVVVKSTDKGGTDAFAAQEGLYTVCVRGIEHGKQVDEKYINASISRVLSASHEWLKVLACASSKEMQVIISNTTESGIKFVSETILPYTPPSSFPGKLVAFLHERYLIFKGAPESGMIILPTELIPNNATVLKEICLKLAEENHYDDGFIHWLKAYNDFCNTLVDRIVPGALPAPEHQKMQEQAGYKDELMIMAEPYRLWAIESSSQRTKDILSFVNTDNSIILSSNIDKYREIKLRLLNAPHTFSCALAVWSGFSTVKEALQDNGFRSFLGKLMFEEIIPVLAGKEITETEARDFADKVLDRFSNPFINHEWLSISLQYTTKLLMRCVPLLVSHYKRSTTLPEAMILGFAAYLLFMKSEINNEGHYSGSLNGRTYWVQDDKSSVLSAHWMSGDVKEVVKNILQDHSLWNMNLCSLPGFEKGINDAVQLLLRNDSWKGLQVEITLRK